MTASPSLTDRIDDLLPQTQCTKCGYSGCRPYAQAVADGTASYNQCPPGGQQGIARLASLLDKPIIPLNPANGVERARPRAVIDETVCIGCTLCMQACPVDAIVGAPKQLHTVLADWCTGCDLCVAPCPVDCIEMVPVTGTATGWDAWSPQQADAARRRHAQRNARLDSARDAAQHRAAARRATMSPSATPVPEGASCGAVREGAGAAPGRPHGATPAAVAAAGMLACEPTAPSRDNAAARKQAIIQAALERARKKKEELAAQGLGPRNTADVSPAVQAQIDAAEARRRRLGLDSGKRATHASEPPPPPDAGKGGSDTAA
ncbi:electron transport complex subunit RsxB [Mycetohabitans sp. B8]|uniref:electron transport complex subunit RsxB n=1 Tax=Mycetohabitans sp. B8 TaxID=2841845 RepID=UPI0034CD4E11